MRLGMWDRAALQYESFFVGQDFLCLGLVKKKENWKLPFLSLPCPLRLCCDCATYRLPPPTLPPPYPPSSQQGVQQHIPFYLCCDCATYRYLDRQTDRQIDRPTDGQTDRHTDRQTDRQADRQRDIHTQTCRRIGVHVSFYRPMGVQRYSIRSP